MLLSMQQPQQFHCEEIREVQYPYLD